MANKKLDSTLIIEVSNGNNKSFELLYKRHYKKVIGILINLNIPEAVLEDLCQNIWVQVWRKAHTFRAESRFTSWLYRIASNEGLIWIRDRKYHPLHNFMNLDYYETNISSEEPLADNILIAKELAKKLNKIYLEEKDTLLFKIFYLSAFTKTSNKAIIKKLNLNPRSISNALYKVKNRFLACIEND